MTHVPAHMIGCTWLGPVYNGYAWLTFDGWHMICGPSWAYDRLSLNPLERRTYPAKLSRGLTGGSPVLTFD